MIKLQDRIDKLMRCAMYKNGEAFTQGKAAYYLDMHSKEAQALLCRMEQDGQLDKAGQNSKGTLLYRRPAPAEMANTRWRKHSNQELGLVISRQFGVAL